MNAPQRTVGTAPTDMAKEIEAIYTQFCIFMNGQDGAMRFSPAPEFFSFPDFPELAASAHVILEGMGRSVDGVDMAQADDFVFRLPRCTSQALGDMPPPRSAEELSELFDRLSSRLEAVAWDLNGQRALGEWCDDEIEEGARVLMALRMIARYSMGYGRGGRE
jgi:hypothetical protein